MNTGGENEAAVVLQRDHGMRHSMRWKGKALLLVRLRLRLGLRLRFAKKEEALGKVLGPQAKFKLQEVALLVYSTIVLLLDSIKSH
jgi:hypothetical protein